MTPKELIVFWREIAEIPDCDEAVANAALETADAFSTLLAQLKRLEE